MAHIPAEKEQEREEKLTDLKIEEVTHDNWEKLCKKDRTKVCFIGFLQGLKQVY